VTSEVISTTAQSATWFQPSIIIPAICVILASALVPILLHYLKGKRDKKDKILEIRTKVYTEYFKAFEEAAKAVGNDYEKFSKVTLKDEFLKLLKAESSPEAIVEFRGVINEFPHKIQESHRKATEQVTTLKILGSKKLYDLTGEFETLNQDILELSSEWLAEMQNSFVTPDFEAPIALKMKAMGERTNKLKDEIISQMRLEINHD
jgi:hypothetical protein